ncbi:porin [Variovorax sp.]|uniref:porin n=1 Tax=Variovorax sp. TaxID=1871043 RepID=UPI002D51742A|nr:porin [Variovorax sp.]HYP86194.1 porin [Variovorax sp.]
MKRPLVALAAMAGAGLATAQSSVTVFGIIDAGVSYYQTRSHYVDTGNGGDSQPHPTMVQNQTVMSSGNLIGSRLGFRGTEDLGGGMAASFWLEAGLANDTGSGFAPNGLGFNRRSTVSLSGGFGEFRLGRDYTPTFLSDNVFDPFATVGAGASVISMLLGGAGGPGTINNLIANPNYVRANNSVSYFLPPNLGGFYGQVMYGLGENVKYDPGSSTPTTLNTARTGRYVGARLGYAKGPLDVAASHGASTIGDDYYGGLTKTLGTSNVAATYDFGLLKLFGEYTYVQVKNDYVNPPVAAPSGDVTANGYLVGMTLPVGPGLIRVAYSHLVADVSEAPMSQGLDLPDPTADKLALGYVHNLSRRTALYTTVAVTRNRNGAAIPPALPPNGTAGYTAASIDDVLNQRSGYRADKGYGWDVGIRHIF